MFLAVTGYQDTLLVGESAIRRLKSLQWPLSKLIVFPDTYKTLISLRMHQKNAHFPFYRLNEKTNFVFASRLEKNSGI